MYTPSHSHTIKNFGELGKVDEALLSYIMYPLFVKNHEFMDYIETLDTHRNSLAVAYSQVSTKGLEKSESRLQELKSLEKSMSNQMKRFAELFTCVLLSGNFAQELIPSPYTLSATTAKNASLSIHPLSFAKQMESISAKVLRAMETKKKNQLQPNSTNEVEFDAELWDTPALRDAVFLKTTLPSLQKFNQNKTKGVTQFADPELLRKSTLSNFPQYEKQVFRWDFRENNHAMIALTIKEIMHREWIEKSQYLTLQFLACQTSLERVTTNEDTPSVSLFADCTTLKQMHKNMLQKDRIPAQFQNELVGDVGLNVEHVTSSFQASLLESFHKCCLLNKTSKDVQSKNFTGSLAGYMSNNINPSRDFGTRQSDYSALQFAETNPMSRFDTGKKLTDTLSAMERIVVLSRCMVSVLNDMRDEIWELRCWAQKIGAQKQGTRAPDFPVMDSLLRHLGRLCSLEFIKSGPFVQQCQAIDTSETKSILLSAMALRRAKRKQFQTRYCSMIPSVTELSHSIHFEPVSIWSDKPCTHWNTLFAIIAKLLPSTRPMSVVTGTNLDAQQVNSSTYTEILQLISLVKGELKDQELDALHRIYLEDVLLLSQFVRLLVFINIDLQEGKLVTPLSVRPIFSVVNNITNIDSLVCAISSLGKVNSTSEQSNNDDDDDDDDHDTSILVTKIKKAN
jgi:hypothetical protein